jgi:hypothetical protein
MTYGCVHLPYSSWAAPVRVTGTVRKRQEVRPVHHIQNHTCPVTLLNQPGGPPCLANLLDFGLIDFNRPTIPCQPESANTGYTAVLPAYPLSLKCFFNLYFINTVTMVTEKQIASQRPHSSSRILPFNFKCKVIHGFRISRTANADFI